MIITIDLNEEDVEIETQEPAEAPEMRPEPREELALQLQLVEDTE